MNFNEVPVGENKGNKYISITDGNPCNYIVKVSGVEAGKNGTGSDYVKITVENQEGQECSERYTFSGGATAISSKNIVSLLEAVYALDGSNEEEHSKAKAIIGDFADYNELASKLTNLLVGKLVAAHFNGKWFVPSDANKNPYIMTTFGYFVPVANFSKLKATPTIKGDAPVGSTNAQPQGIVEQKKTVLW